MVYGKMFSGDFSPPRELRVLVLPDSGCHGSSSSADAGLVGTGCICRETDILAEAGALDPTSTLCLICSWAENGSLLRHLHLQGPGVSFGRRAALRLLFYFAFIFHDERHHSIKISVNQP